MKVSFLWLKEFVDFEVSPHQLADDLSNAGILVETVTPLDSDFILDLDLTTNRPDCLSHMGVAREIATLYQKSLKPIHVQLKESSAPTRSGVAVEIESPKLCARYCARLVRGVKVAPSSEWMVRRLEAEGIRPINNVVDITNYVLMEIGHPLHAFDLSKVGGQKIIVREARNGERLVTIDGVERVLSNGMLVIADESRPVALAGIMGGVESEISLLTNDVLLESAWFDPLSIRKTSKVLGLHTDASHRFERGADILATVRAIDRAAALIQELSGGEVLQGIVDCYPRPAVREPIVLRKSRIAQVMGVEIHAGEVERILTALGFQIIERTAAGWKVHLPTFRLDVEREIDLVEEIARHYGYQKFPSTLPAWSGSSHRRPEYSRERLLKERLLHLGYFETISYSFIDQSENQKFSNLEPVHLLNPLSSEMGVMRTSLLPGLLHSLLRNYNRGMKSVRLYETGKIYRWCNAQQPREEVYLGMVASGNYREKNVHGDDRPLNFFDLKGDIEILLESFSLPLNEVCFKETQESIPTSSQYYHPGIAAEICFRDQRLGIFGQLHPKVCEEYKIRQPVFVAEIPLDIWYNLKVKEKIFREIAKFPSIQRDLSIVVDKDMDYSKIESVILGANIGELQRVFPFDLYVGEKLPSSKKGVTISIVYQATDRTLTEEEVNLCQEKILALLKEKLRAQLRT